MKPITFKVWDLDDLVFGYATKHNLNPRKFGDTFIKKYIPDPLSCNYADICFNTNNELDKSIIEFMELEVPLGDDMIYATFRL